MLMMYLVKMDIETLKYIFRSVFATQSFVLPTWFQVYSQIRLLYTNHVSLDTYNRQELDDTCLL